MICNVIATGSKGNAVVVNDIILIDCGVPFKALKNVYKQLKLVLLTHKHSDHFKASTIRTLARERPALRFGCCGWLREKLIAAGVNERNIDVYSPDQKYDYKQFKLLPVMLAHDVPNCGYRLYFGSERGFYATDTDNLYGVDAKGYDLYMLEANYTEPDIMEIIKEKEDRGEYAYEKRKLHTHMSKEYAEKWVADNMGENSMIIWLHGSDSFDNNS